MLRLIVQRLLLLIPLLLGLSILLFGWVRALPGGPVQAMLGERYTPEAAAAIEAEMGLDQPLPVQYGKYLLRLLQGDFGVSLQSGRPVLDEFLTRFPATIELTIVALVFAIGIGIPLGYVAARRAGSVIDHSAVVVSLIGVTVPVFFLAFILKYIFAVELGWFPTTGRLSATMVATHPTNFYVLDGLLTAEWDAAWDALVDRYNGLVWSVARSHRLSSVDASDVVQTTWLRLVVDHINRLLSLILEGVQR